MVSMVTGAGGFASRYLIEELKKKGHEIVATKLKNEDCTISGIKVLDMDICDAECVSNIIKSVKPDIIFHLAAQSSVSLSWKAPQLTAQINVIGTINILEAVRLYSSSTRVMLVGSSEEYGEFDGKPVAENSKTNPQSIYAVTKHTQNQLGKVYSKAYGLDVVLLRPFNHIGAGQSCQYVISDFCNQVSKIQLNKQDAEICVGNLNVYREFLDVRDVVCAYIIAAEQGKSGETYNVGRGEAYSLKDIAEKIISFCDKPVKIVVDENKFRPSDNYYVCADNTKLKALGWRTKYSIDDSLKDVYQYWLKINS